MVDFEYDEAKKLGIDFHEAQALWDDPDMLEFPAKSDNEPRLFVIGRILKKCWSAIITYRGERIRLISVRRSRKKEVELYESERFR